MERKGRGAGLLAAAIFLAVVTAPFIAAQQSGGEQHVFGGILFNPLDGNTYLAKAYQGFEGDWKFRLPYTAEPGEGAFINLYYLFLGHLSRWLGLPVVLVYNLARAAGAGLLVFSLWRFYGAVLSTPRARLIAFIWSSLALGMGWVLLPAGVITSDLWVAEAYPFLAALTNPHFPLALALIALLATPSPGRLAAPFALVASFLLAVVSPFGIVITLLPWAGALGFELLDRSSPAETRQAFIREAAFRIAALLVGGGPVLLYDWLAIRADPVLAGWDAQNLAASPAWWDLLLSFSPTLLLAIPAMRRAPRLLSGWLVLGLLLVVIPFDLQRRFLMGLQVPAAGLAAAALAGMRPRPRRWAALGVLLALAPGPLLLLATAQAGIAARSPLLYLFPAEVEAFSWVEAHTGPEDLILAAPETGLFIPAYTGRRVIYGHPFETVDADAERAAVEAFFAGSDTAAAQQFLHEREVDWIFFGPREAALGGLPPGLAIVPSFTSGSVTVYRVLP